MGLDQIDIEPGTVKRNDKQQVIRLFQKFLPIRRFWWNHKIYLEGLIRRSAILTVFMKVHLFNFRKSFTAVFRLTDFFQELFSDPFFWTFLIIEGQIYTTNFAFGTLISKSCFNGFNRVMNGRNARKNWLLDHVWQKEYWDWIMFANAFCCKCFRRPKVYSIIHIDQKSITDKLLNSIHLLLRIIGSKNQFKLGLPSLMNLLRKKLPHSLFVSV